MPKAWEGEVGVKAKRDASGEIMSCIGAHLTLPRFAWAPPSPPTAWAERGHFLPGSFTASKVANSTLNSWPSTFSTLRT